MTYLRFEEPTNNHYDFVTGYRQFYAQIFVTGLAGNSPGSKSSDCTPRELGRSA